MPVSVSLHPTSGSPAAFLHGSPGISPFAITGSLRIQNTSKPPKQKHLRSVQVAVKYVTTTRIVATGGSYRRQASLHPVGGLFAGRHVWFARCLNIVECADAVEGEEERGPVLSPFTPVEYPFEFEFAGPTGEVGGLGGPRSLPPVPFNLKLAGSNVNVGCYLVACVKTVHNSRNGVARLKEQWCKVDVTPFVWRDAAVVMDVLRNPDLPV
ncbi:hypothetical protein HK104_006092, partial [Borealophlyctis nickersoniae]